MLFYFGFFFLLAGIVMIIIFTINYLRPKAEASLLKVTEEYPKTHELAPQRKLPFAEIEYYYNHTKYNEKIMLKSRKHKVGDTIRVSIKVSNPKKAIHYSPVREVLAIIVVNAIGATLIIISIVVIDLLK